MVQGLQLTMNSFANSRLRIARIDNRIEQCSTPQLLRVCSPVFAGGVTRQLFVMNCISQSQPKCTWLEPCVWCVPLGGASAHSTLSTHCTAQSTSLVSQPLPHRRFWCTWIASVVAEECNCCAMFLQCNTWLWTRGLWSGGLLIAREKRTVPHSEPQHIMFSANRCQSIIGRHFACYQMINESDWLR